MFFKYVYILGQQELRSILANKEICSMKFLLTNRTIKIYLLFTFFQPHLLYYTDQQCSEKNASMYVL